MMHTRFGAEAPSPAHSREKAGEKRWDKSPLTCISFHLHTRVSGFSSCTKLISKSLIYLPLL